MKFFIRTEERKGEMSSKYYPSLSYDVYSQSLEYCPSFALIIVINNIKLFQNTRGNRSTPNENSIPQKEYYSPIRVLSLQ